MPDPKSGTPTRPFKLAKSTWIVGAISLLLLIIGLASSGLAGLLIMGGLIGAITTLYVIITGRRSWAHIPSRKFAAITLAACVVAFGVGGAGTGGSSPVAPKLTSAAIDAAPTFSPAAPAIPSESPTPVPVSHLIENYTPSTPAVAQSTLMATGYSVVMKTSDGTIVTDPTGWNIQSQEPAPGTSLPEGSVVTLTLVQPPPPPPPPAPKPAPAPAPAPNVVSPITPGAFCANADHGKTGIAANGKSYICGGKGADANGHYHWNS